MNPAIFWQHTGTYYGDFSIEKCGEFGDFGTFFSKTILCMSSSTGFFWLQVSKILQKGETLVETQLEAHKRSAGGSGLNSNGEYESLIKV
jgi:hypothetical protein